MKFEALSKQRIIYGLLGLVALLAVIALLLTFSKQQVLERQRIAGEHRQRELQRTVDAALQNISALGEEEDAPSHFTAGENGLSVSSQEAGNAVLIDSLVLSDPGFAVIYKREVSTETFVNASSLLQRGAYTIVSIAAPEKLTPRTDYHAAIYHDSNGDGLFDAGTDKPVVDKDGAIMTAVFGVE